MAQALKQSSMLDGQKVSMAGQEYGVRELRKERAPGDPNKYSELESASAMLLHSWRFFMALKAGLDKPGRQSPPADKKKLTAHISFCLATFNKAKVSSSTGPSTSSQSACNCRVHFLSGCSAHPSCPWTWTCKRPLLVPSRTGI